MNKLVTSGNKESKIAKFLLINANCYTCTFCARRVKNDYELSSVSLNMEGVASTSGFVTLEWCCEKNNLTIKSEEVKHSVCIRWVKNGIR